MTEQAGSDYERSDIEASTVGLIAAGLATFVVAIPLLMPLVFPQSVHRGPPTVRPPIRNGAPGLQVTPAKDWQHFDSAQQDHLNSYGWIDRDRNIVRIPVAQATDRLLKTGLPGWPSP